MSWLLLQALADANSTAESCKHLWEIKEGSYRRLAAQTLALWQQAKPPRSQFLFDMYEPAWSCESKERVGSAHRNIAWGDGPKFMCGVDVLNQPCLVYSVGSNNDIQFEESMHNLTRCEIHTFDPTLKAPFKGGAISTFHDIGLNGSRPQSFKVAPLLAIIRDLHHDGRRIDVLKIDCEGCEFGGLDPVFEAMRQRNLSVGQLLLEVHASSGSHELLIKLFSSAMSAGLRLFSKERNGWGCQGFRCVEFSFVDKLQACASFIATHCPGVSAGRVCE